MIVDVSRKPDVSRYAKASVEISVDVCNTASAIRAAANAYRYLPFLHPLPLSASAHCRDGKLYVEGFAEWQTGVEMDVLFGALTGAVASGSTALKNLSVDVKRKGVAQPVTPLQPVETALTREGDLLASAYGEMEMRNLELVNKPVEKGHPLHAAQTAVALNVKRLCELVGGTCPAVQHLKIDVDVADALRAHVTIKARDLPPAPEALFAVGVAFLTIWDMLKKWEKDEEGQYPHTKVRIISLERG
jgi:cyclic pyranopterin phosphate synthase